MDFREENYENAIMEQLDELGFTRLYGPDIDRDYRNPLFMDALTERLPHINPKADAQAVAEALSKLTRLDHGTLIQQNKQFTDWLQNGLEVSYQKDGQTRHELVRLIDYDNPGRNSFHAVNQWTVVENETKRPDVVVFVNGLPLVVIELKSCLRAEGDIFDAYRQIKNYQHEIPTLFAYNAFSIISDLVESKVGTITAGADRFVEWKTIDGDFEENRAAQYDVLFKGMLKPDRFLEILKHFILFSQDTLEDKKILAAYHQFFAVKKAIESTSRAVDSDGKGGVFWHTQGSGKSLSMVFYAAGLQKALGSPTIVVITDRNDLDDQLYGQFCACQDFLRQTPRQAESREHLRELLAGRKVGGIFFTTMQKFEEASEPLSDRRDIIVMADEAHRGHYGLNEKVGKDGTIHIGAARLIRDSLSQATFIGFTGTPVSSKDRNTREVFGDYIDIYDMTQAVEDGASALKEGWDNPNVFQVCTLLEQKSTFTCRQKVGRGLRLCVNQDGERLEDKNINILHVMASESFAEFAANLQKEIEDETGLKFGVLEIALFSGLIYEQPKTVEKVLAPAQAKQFVQELTRQGYLQDDGCVKKELAADLSGGKVELPPELVPAAEAVAKAVESRPETPLSPDAMAGLTYTAVVTEEKTINYDEAKELVDHFQKKKYIDKAGRMAQTMKEALRDGTLDLPQKFEAAREKLETVIRRADNRPKIRDASKEVTVRLNKRALLSPEFMAIWDRIKHKTAYRVAVDQTALTAKCLKALKAMDPIPKTRLVTQTADLNIEKSGVTHTERGLRTADLEAANPLPDILLIWQEECGLTLQLGRDLLIESGCLIDFVNNPQLFIEKSIPLLGEAIHSLEIDGIRYMKLAGQEYYVQEIFDSEELLASLDNNAVPVGHSLYDHIVYDSETVEKPFAQALDNDPEVKMFFKLPSKFKIETPLGSYNPDWAVYLDRDGAQKLYFVLETKGSAKETELRLKEKLKIHCGREHFKALDNDVQFTVTSVWKDFRVDL